MEISKNTNLKALLNRYKITPAKIRGQNFLISEKVLAQIVNAAELSKEDIVLEIGPGVGTLTRELCIRTGFVVAVENDPQFSQIINDISEEFKNLKVYYQDILKFDLNLIGDSASIFKRSTSGLSYKVVANIPYNITSEILIKFLQSNLQPKYLVLMVQKEVAERILERDGKSSRLSIFVNYFGKPEIIAHVPAACFWPKPKVDSAILKIVTHNGFYQNNLDKQKDFFELVKLGFISPRKKLLSNLCKKIKRDLLIQAFDRTGISSNARPENLNFSAWRNLFDNIRYYSK